MKYTTEDDIELFNGLITSEKLKLPPCLQNAN